MKKKNFNLKLFNAIVVGILLTGCATTPDPYAIIERQKKEIGQLKERLKQREEEFKIAQNTLMSELKEQIEAGKIKIENLKRGLVLSMLEDILFDSGKAEIKPEGKEALIKVANVLKEDCSNKNVSIEGHTDNEPIKYSGWKSNWELSTVRANSVLHFFIDECGIKPERLRVVGFGEYGPVASNETKEGRQQNRRVEIVILPEKTRKVEAGF